MRVVALASEPILVYELGIACQVFGIDRSDDLLPNYDFMVCSERPGPIATTSGFAVEVPHPLSVCDEADIVVLPGWHDLDTPPSPAVAAALQRADHRSAVLLSICTGSFALAGAGVLDGRAATTHWQFAELFAERFPQVQLSRNELYVDSGNLITSGGASAGVDAALHLVRRLHGGRVANRLARRLVAPPHRAGDQAQFTETPVPETEDLPGVSHLLQWIDLNLAAEALTVAQLARRAAMSERSFTRQFRRVTGTSPSDYVTSRRINLARTALEQGAASIEQIATRAGFGTADSLRYHFRQTLGISPTDYRRTFDARAGAHGAHG